MNCSNCGNALSQGDLFCGQCGYSMEPTILSTHAPTVAAGLDVASATILENPYHLLLTGLNMPNLILDDDIANIWTPDTGVSLQGYKLLKIQGYDFDQYDQYSVSLMKRVQAFTFEATVTSGLMLGYGFSGSLEIECHVGGHGSVKWEIGFRKSVGNLSMRAFSEKERSLRLKAHLHFPNLELKSCSASSLHHDGLRPFLLGIVWDEFGIYVFCERKPVGELRFVQRVPLVDSGWQMRAIDADFLISHTKVWVP